MKQSSGMVLIIIQMLTTRWATHSNAYVHEGHFFVFLPAIYDLLYDDPVLTEKDHENIQKTLRLYLKTCKSWHIKGGISNWLTNANSGAICTSLVLQDMKELDYFLDCKNGFKVQLTRGVMGDDWWKEGPSNYSYLVLGYYSLVAIACQNWGINLFEFLVPHYQPNFLVSGGLKKEENDYLGMKDNIWGTPGEPYGGLKEQIT